MSTISLRLPDSLHQTLRVLAAKEQVSINQLIALAVAEKVCVKWMGWTPNFARPSAIPLVGLLLSVLAIPSWIVAANGAGFGRVLVTTGAAIAVVCGLCA
jgi:uncharacterized membrane protein